MRSLVAALAGAALALPAVAAAQAPVEDRVVGSGNLPGPSSITFAVDVGSGPSGENPTGGSGTASRGSGG